MARAAHTDQPVAALMMDLDGLKEVNRTQGHLAGDRGIAAVGQLLQSVCRREDLVCRFGGDEFCLLLPGVSLEQAALVGERIRFTAQETVVAGFVVGRGLSLSIGVAVAEPGEDVTALLNRADEGLLEAKHRGATASASSRRNRLELTVHGRIAVSVGVAVGRDVGPCPRA
jgi:diguanylate cyclase (GGDEF)-like protein